MGKTEPRDEFEEFFRSHDPSTAGVAGTGLGLAIVKHLTASMGGRVEVASRSDETRFTVSFPRAPQELDELPSQDGPA